MTTEEAADAVIERLQQRGWHQGASIGPDGHICVMQAITPIIADQQAFCQLTGRLLAHANALGFGLTSEWNDDPHTTYEDVILALKQAGRP